MSYGKHFLPIGFLLQEQGLPSSKLFPALTNLQDDGDAEEWDHCATPLNNLLRAPEIFP
jgi:hypothetical protein